MSTLFQLGVLLLFLEGAVQCREQISSHNGLMVKTSEHDWQRGDKQVNSVQCSVCIKIVDYIFKSVGKELSKDGIENALRNVCKKIIFHKTCETLVHKYKDKLIRTILNGKNVHETCRHLSLCKHHV